jgi:hypothetical protein
MGAVMKQQFTGAAALWLAVALMAGGQANRTDAADIEEDPAAALRLAQKASRSCTESCMSECRAEKTDCTEGKTDAKISCRAQFQICVRRCVVACSPK